MSLHEGCEKILVSDSVFLADKMYKAHKRGVKCNRKFTWGSPFLHYASLFIKPILFLKKIEDMICSICDEPVFDEINVEDIPNSIIFFCRHAYHQQCLVPTTTSNTANSIADNNPGSLTSKVNQSALLKSTQQSMGCPLCREQMAGGNAFVNRMKSTKRGGGGGGRISSPQSPRADSIRSFGTVH